MANNTQTIKANDLSAVGPLYQRVSADGVARPWGAPDGITAEAAQHRAALAAQLLQQVTGLLDLLQREHRDGHLDPDDLEALHGLQVWYAKLHAEVDHAHLARPTPAGSVET